MNTTTTTTYFIQGKTSKARRAKYFKNQATERGTGRKYIVMTDTPAGARQFPNREYAEVQRHLLASLYERFTWTVTEKVG